MHVSDEVRQVEQEIDDEVRTLPLWRCARELAVRGILDYYRQTGEVLLLAMSWAARQEPSERAERFERIFLFENRKRAAVFYALKWALTLCPEQSAEACNETLVHTATEVGTNYEALVDALKFASRGLVQIEVDREARSVTVYEGGEMTGDDWAFVEH